MRLSRPGYNCQTHPDEVDVSECACEQLAFPLPSWSGGEKVTLQSIDHLSPWAMRLSCGIWLEDAASVCAAEPISLPLGDGRFTEAIHRHGGFKSWPIPIEADEFQLVLVLRQWVEEPEDPQLGKLVESHPAWRLVLDRLNESSNDWRTELQPEKLAAGLTSRPGQPSGEAVDLNLLYENHRESLVETVRSILHSCGLPGTRSTALYFLKRESPHQIREQVAGAARGLLVTSFGLVAKPESGLGVCQMVSQVASVYPWTTDALQREAAKVTREHVQWWKERADAQFPKGDVRHLDNRQPDELSFLVARYRAGEVVRARLEEFVLEDARAEKGKALSPDEKRKAIRKLNARLYRLFQKDRSR